MEAFQFGDAQKEIHDFLWNEYCDWFIELAKIRIASGSEGNPIPVLIFTLERTLRLLHPFMPFITEEIWGILCESVGTPDDWEEALIVSEYPVMREDFYDIQSEEEMNLLFELIGAIRNIRGELRIKQNTKLNASMISPEYYQLLEDHKKVILKLAGVDLSLSEAAQSNSNVNSVTLVTTGVTSYIDMGEGADMATEISRLEEEKEEISGHAISLEKRLSNPGFVGNAPDDVIEKERDRLKKALERVERLDGILSKFN
jgi:valyl-tRNA synthetase